MGGGGSRLGRQESALLSLSLSLKLSLTRGTEPLGSPSCCSGPEPNRTPRTAGPSLRVMPEPRSPWETRPT